MQPAGRRRDEVGEAAVRHTGAMLALLADVVQTRDFVRVGLVAVDGNVVFIDLTRRKQTEHTVRGQPFLLDDEVEHRLRLVPELARGLRCGRVVRSEEHTSELQSLMRISYAVFCLKKKN